MALWLWALWGFLGAFVYAAPRISVAFGESSAGASQPLRKYVYEFVVALTFGPIFALAAGEWLAQHLGRTALFELRALAFVIGLASNPIAPILVKAVKGDILGRLGMPKGDDNG